MEYDLAFVTYMLDCLALAKRKAPALDELTHPQQSEAAYLLATGAGITTALILARFVDDDTVSHMNDVTEG